MPLVPILWTEEITVSKKPRENRVPIMMSDEELKMIDDWRFEHRIPTRSEAVRRLAKMGELLDRRMTGVAKAVRFDLLGQGPLEKVLARSKGADEQLAAMFSYVSALEKSQIATFLAVVAITAEVGAILGKAPVGQALEEAESLRRQLDGLDLRSQEGISVLVEIVNKVKSNFPPALSDNKQA